MGIKNAWLVYSHYPILIILSKHWLLNILRFIIHHFTLISDKI
jgi:hypothetical protein